MLSSTSCHSVRDRWTTRTHGWQNHRWDKCCHCTHSQLFLLHM